MSLKLRALADGLKAYLGIGANDVLEIDDTAKIVKPVSPYIISNGGPCFRATRTNTQSVTGSQFNKINFNVEEFDTNNCFDLTTDKFTPNVPGYYKIQGTTYGTGGNNYAIIYKNGTLYQYGTYGVVGVVETLVYLNGTTDYVELYTYPDSTGTAIGDGTLTVFSGCFIRS